MGIQLDVGVKKKVQRQVCEGCVIVVSTSTSLGVHAVSNNKRCRAKIVLVFCIPFDNMDTWCTAIDPSTWLLRMQHYQSFYRAALTNGAHRFQQPR